MEEDRPQWPDVTLQTTIKIIIVLSFALISLKIWEKVINTSTTTSTGIAIMGTGVSSHTESTNSRGFPNIRQSYAPLITAPGTIVLAVGAVSNIKQLQLPVVGSDRSTQYHFRTLRQLMTCYGTAQHMFGREPLFGYDFGESKVRHLYVHMSICLQDMS